MHSERGFTLAEILITISIFLTLVSLTVFFSMNEYRTNSLRSDRALLISLLMHARSLAQHDICFGDLCQSGESHGVHVGFDAYTVFQGSDFATRNVAFDARIAASEAIHRTGLLDVVFATSSGNALNAGEITLSDDSNHISIISIGHEGQIAWSK